MFVGNIDNFPYYNDMIFNIFGIFYRSIQWKYFDCQLLQDSGNNIIEMKYMLLLVTYAIRKEIIIQQRF